ncbi:thiamine pyrophosphate-binding protein [Lichenifustis flavocetrariae]|uniref:Thiamine pyrophosphate-binding protein n=1 Tax=Lichenifustis flavocetrariae TaxID=2949735 RepID=A0AA41YY54_9HYPH|nr:thiamine pyrophosphate-binding protein [Lichenifustis flavocetrariae]MCW6510724.1 thiamine pyrophosphate-binding protein [Lichenifustis flavocetrariae]
MIQTTITPLDSVEPRRGAAVMLEVLRSEGVRYIFGNPGTTELALMDALTEAPDIGYIWGLQEASVVAMADGYANASGRPGFVNLHTAGGLGHAMGALINAQVSNTPLVVTAGQQDMRHNLTDPLLFGDLVRIASPAMKWATEIITPDQIPVLIRRAFHDCTAAPSGPVFLSLPMNVMEQMSTVEIAEVSTIDRAAVAGSLDVLSDRLSAIKPGRIAIIAGDEISPSGASAEAVALAEVFGAPVFGSSWPAHIPFPTAHPLWCGNLPTKASEIRAILEPYDAVFALGGKSLITILYSDGPAVPQSCQVFQLSSDVRDLGRTYATALSCMGDIKASLKVLLPMLDRKLARHRGAIATLRDEAGRAREARRSALRDRARAEFDAPVTTPFVAASEVVRAIGPQVAIIDEAPATMINVRSLLESSSARQYSACRGGGLGWGMPAAVGWSLGLDRQPVVSLVGDGASLYSPQALWTAAYEKLPVTFVVMNNREYNILKNFSKSQPHYLSPRKNRFIAMDITDPPIDFLALATSMGVAGRRVVRASDIAGAVEEGIASGVPNVIEVPISVN